MVGVLKVLVDGVWVPAAATGPAGVAGAAGPTGATGAAGATGATGTPGIVVDDVAPVDTTLLWADTSEGGNVTLVQVHTYTDADEDRPDATVVFWIPDPYDLDNPTNALVDDLVLRSTPDVAATLADHEARIAALE